MAKITPGNRLYLYRLLTQALGQNKQTLLPDLEAALAADSIAPADLGCKDIRALCDALPEFVRVTVFKKGSVYATVVANAEYDAALERAAKGTGDGKKSFKRKGPKSIKPQRPRHIEEPKAKVPVAEADAAPQAAEASAPEETTEAAPDANEPQVKRSEGPEAITLAELLARSASQDAEPGEHESEGETEAESATPGEAEPKPEAADVPAVEPEGPASPTAAAPATEAEAPAEAKPEGSPAIAADPEPSIKLTITYVPEPEPAPDPASTPEPEPEPAQAREPEAAVAPKPEALLSKPKAEAKAAPKPKIAPDPARHFPQDFYAEVRVTDEPLSALYQALPLDVDPVATLEEDFRIARSTGAFTGTRSEVTFPLRFEQADGTPATATLRRCARAVGGKKWTLAEVSVDAPEEVGMGSLKRRPVGPWATFANEDQLKGHISPEAELAQFAVLGSWEKLLEELAELAAPEDWGEGRVLLRDYLAMTFARAKRQHRVSMADDGSGAAFDTGLVTADGEPIAAVLEPHDGDIQWELTCFSANAQARPVTYPSPFAQAEAPANPREASIGELRRRGGEVAPSLHRALQRAARNPRYGTLAYDAVEDRVVALLPVEGGVAALAPNEENEPQVVAVVDAADAYVCARVVSSDQPVWLMDAAQPA